MQAAVAEAITGLHRTERRRQKRTTDRKGQLWIQPKVRRQTAARRLPGENAYAAYQGYAYAEADGQVKYALDATDGLRLYCYFQSDSRHMKRSFMI